VSSADADCETDVGGGAKACLTVVVICIVDVSPPDSFGGLT